MRFSRSMAVVLAAAFVGAPCLSAEPANAGEDAQPMREDAPTEQRLQPRMRAVDRDREWFEQLECDSLEQVVTHSETEARWLEYRKRACVDHYRAFLPVPVEPPH